MDIVEYQEQARTTAIYEDATLRTTAQRTQNEMVVLLNLVYTTGKLNGEAGELIELVCKAIRDDNGKLTAERREALRAELGDVLWYVSQIATCLGIYLDDVANRNLIKLQDRKDRGVLHGSGDTR